MIVVSNDATLSTVRSSKPELGPSRFFSVQDKSQVSISNFKSSHKSNASLKYLCKYKSSQNFFSKSSHKYLT